MHFDFSQFEPEFIDVPQAMRDEHCAPVLCAVDYAIERSDAARVKGYRGVCLGDIDVLCYEGVGLHHGNREAQHIDVDQLDDYLVTIPLHAHIDIAQRGHRGAIEPGSFALLSTSSPFTASVCGLQPQEAFIALQVRVAGAALRRRMPIVEQCCGRGFKLRDGAGVILKRMCELALSEGRHLTASEAAQFGAMLIDAVVTATSEAPEVLASPAVTQRSTALRIYKQALRYIEEQLPNPGLDTASVAQHCRVSKRYLQAVFTEMGQTVCGVVREARLQRCREALRNPALRQQSVAQIALHWGFNDLPNFCRSYKARFDVSPGRDRLAPRFSEATALVA